MSHPLVFIRPLKSCCPKRIPTPPPSPLAPTGGAESGGRTRSGGGRSGVRRPSRPRRSPCRSGIAVGVWFHNGVGRGGGKLGQNNTHAQSLFNPSVDPLCAAIGVAIQPSVGDATILIQPARPFLLPVSWTFQHWSELNPIKSTQTSKYCGYSLRLCRAIFHKSKKFSKRTVASPLHLLVGVGSDS